jgi:hypothetical protein
MTTTCMATAVVMFRELQLVATAPHDTATRAHVGFDLAVDGCVHFNLHAEVAQAIGFDPDERPATVSMPARQTQALDYLSLRLPLQAAVMGYVRALQGPDGEPYRVCDPADAPGRGRRFVKPMNVAFEFRKVLPTVAPPAGAAPLSAP